MAKYEVNTPVLQQLRFELAEMKEQLEPITRAVEDFAKRCPDAYWSASALNHYRCFVYAARRACLELPPTAPRPSHSDFFPVEEEYDNGIGRGHAGETLHLPEPEFVSEFL